MRADKEGGADFVLKIANTATDGRFLNAQNLRGATKAPLLSGSNYIAEMA